MVSSALFRIECCIRAALPDDRGAVACAVKGLSDAFTKERDELSHAYLDDPQNRLAYLAGFLLPNAAKALHVFGQLAEATELPRRERITLLDIGCGPATASLAASAFFSERAPGRELIATGLEQSPAILAEGERLFAALGNERHRFEGIAARITRASITRHLSGRRFDLICASNLLNELADAEEAYALLHRLAHDHLAEGGALLVIDPALKKTTRPLMHIRDRLLHEKALHVIAPCLHQGPCPMLGDDERARPPREPSNARRRGRDWCHFFLEWERPKLIREIDEQTGLDRRYLKMAYFVFSKEFSGSRVNLPAGRQADHVSRPRWRVVSSPLKSKGKLELVLCGANGELRRIMRLDREAGPANADLDRAKRGDIVETEALRRLHTNDRFEIMIRWQEWPTIPSPRAGRR